MALGASPCHGQTPLMVCWEVAAQPIVIGETGKERAGRGELTEARVLFWDSKDTKTQASEPSSFIFNLSISFSNKKAGGYAHAFCWHWCTTQTASPDFHPRISHDAAALSRAMDFLKWSGTGVPELSQVMGLAMLACEGISRNLSQIL